MTFDIQANQRALLVLEQREAIVDIHPLSEPF
ncbi:hypothetical protein COLO4_08126 [Corchorus olitorius]|uniref:Uncharacterized protein n=1 Tax=Corchorus olitorius TaxID=93759 RepID=A0A1R3KH91_9ROSI|nr:hypothetical protein COLO4_08126 [Corchorus olitorius]